MDPSRLRIPTENLKADLTRPPDRTSLNAESIDATVNPNGASPPNVGSSLGCDHQRLKLFLSGGLRDATEHQALEDHLLHCQRCAADAAAMPDAAWVKNLVAGVPRVAARHRLADAYEIAEEIGRGGAGIVYRAWQRPVGRWVALKMLIGGVAAQPKPLARFRREAAALAKLTHPQIVRILDSGEQDGVPYLAMELIDGPTLAHALALHRPTAQQSAKIVAELARGIASAHQNGIIHRDLNPQNVLMAMAALGDPGVPTSSGQARQDTFPVGSGKLGWENAFDFAAAQPKIADFGLSLIDDECFATQTGESLGTPAYVAPEMLNPQLGRVSETTDIYGLGTILYQCLYGRTPFVGAQPFELIDHVLNHEPNWDTTGGPVPADLRIICQKCLEKKPQARFQSAAELEQELTRFLQGVPIRSREIGRLERVGRWCRRNPWPTVAALVLAVSGVAIVAMLLVFQSQLIRQRDQAQRNYDEARKAIWEILDKNARESALEVPKLTEMQLAQLRPAMSFFERLAQAAKTDEAQLDLARIQIQLASTLIARHEFAEGERLLLTAMDQLQQMAGESPLRDAALLDAFSATTKYALSISFQGRGPESLKLVEPLLTPSEQLCERHPQDWSYRSHRAWIIHNLAFIQQHCGDLPAAQQSFETAIRERQRANELHQQQHGQRPLNWELELGETYVNLATIELTLQQSTAAIEDFDRAQELMQQAIDRDPKNVRVLTSAAIVQLNLSNLHASQQQMNLAFAACERGIAWIEQILEADPNSIDAREHGAMLYGNRAIYREQSDDNLPLLVADWQRASELFQSPDNRNYALLQSAKGLLQAKRWPEAAKTLDRVELSVERQDLVAYELSLRAELLNHFHGEQAKSESEPTEPNATASVAAQVQWWQRQLVRLKELGFFTDHPSSSQSLREGDEFAVVRQLIAPEFWSDSPSK